MNYNISAYIVYLILTGFIIVFVGKLFYRNGRMFILGLMKDDAARTDHLNNILLVAYYLFNIGYAFVKLSFWQSIENLAKLVSSIANNMSVLIFILASTHYLNMVLIWYLSRSKKSPLTIKSFQS
ncbi:MAG TPA: hypothetical protein VK622_01360 [Puia sp.]|nr:hypothetical protein [Puia sp.]